MLPCIPANNIAQRVFTEPKSLCQGFLRLLFQRINTPNLFNLRFRNFCSIICGTNTRLFLSWCLSIFHKHILNIFLLCSQEKMVGTDAFLIIASVANIESLGYWSIGQLKRNAMSRHFSVASRLNTHSYLPVSTFVFISSPVPTRGRFLNIFPKSIFDGQWLSWHGGVLS